MRRKMGPQQNTRALFALVVLILGGCAENQISDSVQSERLVPGIFLEEASRRGGLPQGEEPRKMSDVGLNITKEHEGWVSARYDDPAGYCTIGYGHLLQRGNCNGKEPGEFSNCDVSTAGEFRKPIAKSRGEQVLRCDMNRAEIAVQQLARKDLTDGQFAALADFTFNVGTRKFEGSTLRKVVNNGDYQRVPIEFRKWVLAGGKKYRGLQERREKEIRLFFDGASRGGKPKDSELIDIRVGE